MLLGASYPLLDVFWTMLIFFVWIAWFMLLFRIIGDIFRRHDIGGGGKTLWMIFVIVLPFLGVFIYIIAENKGMTERDLERAQEQKAQFDAYVQIGGRLRRRRRGDRKGEAIARQRCDHAERIRRHQGEGARHLGRVPLG